MRAEKLTPIMALLASCWACLVMGRVQIPLRPEVSTQYYISPGGESLRIVLEQKLGFPTHILYDQNYLKKIKRWNPHVEDFDNLQAGEEIYLEYPYGMIMAVPVLVEGLDEEQLVEEQKEEEPVKVARTERRMGLFSFFTMSKGTFNEKVKGSSVEVISEQNSPASLGMGGFYQPSNHPLSYNSSLYFSYLTASDSNTGQEINVPLEYGLNIYGEYNNPIASPYFGYDFERFSTFNTEELANGVDLTTREHTLHYATVGIGKSFQVGRRGFLFKASYSTVLSSSNNAGVTALSGSKAILYLNTRITKKVLAHVLYKMHFMSGTTDLNIQRIGFGLGYSFF